MGDMCYISHSSFIEELDHFISRHGNGHISVEEALRHIEKLLTIHFTEMLQFTSKHLGRAQEFGAFEVYWLHMIIPDCHLSRTQFPKAYFYKQDFHLCFLCLDSHIDNYKDSKLRKLAKIRLSEILELLKTHICEKLQ